jgi:hypothetical protein
VHRDRSNDLFTRSSKIVWPLAPARTLSRSPPSLSPRAGRGKARARHGKRSLFAALALTFGALAPAHADEPKATPIPPATTGPATVFTYARENPECSEWTNACQTCTRDEKGAPQCSTPGIACTPGVLTCRVKKGK